MIVALIAATRRVLVLTAEFSRLMELGAEAFQNAMIELGLLIVMITALVLSMTLLRKMGPRAPREHSRE